MIKISQPTWWCDACDCDATCERGNQLSPTSCPSDSATTSFRSGRRPPPPDDADDDNARFLLLLPRFPPPQEDEGGAGGAAIAGALGGFLRVSLSPSPLMVVVVVVIVGSGPDAAWRESWARMLATRWMETPAYNGVVCCGVLGERVGWLGLGWGGCAYGVGGGTQVYVHV